jgi:hypothetical protein
MLLVTVAATAVDEVDTADRGAAGEETKRRAAPSSALEGARTALVAVVAAAVGEVATAEDGGASEEIKR